MTNKMRELTALGLTHIAQSCLRIQGQDLGLRHHEETLE
jgi:hypothetical protein